MFDPTAETKRSRCVDAIYSDAYDRVARSLRDGKLWVADELRDHPELSIAFDLLLSEHFRRETTPEVFAHQMSTLLCDLVSELAEWEADRKR